MKHEYRKLGIWQKARELTSLIYTISNSFPDTEKYGLKNQITRASVSVVSNIAEGSGYESNAQFRKFLQVSLGSLCEIETQLYVAFDLTYIKEDLLNSFIEKTDELKRMLLSFHKTIK